MSSQSRGEASIVKASIVIFSEVCVGKSLVVEENAQELTHVENLNGQ
jgi:hypothetical protein